MFVHTQPSLPRTAPQASRRRARMSLSACVTLAALAVLQLVTGAAGTAQTQAARRYAYKLIDLGTFGGPQAGQGNGPYVNLGGRVAGTADTATADPYAPNDNPSFNGDPFVQHAFL